MSTSSSIRPQLAFNGAKGRAKGFRAWSQCTSLSGLLSLGGLGRKAIPLVVTSAISIWASSSSPVADERATFPRRVLMPGLQWIRWDGKDYCRAGDPAIGVLVVNPEQFAFRIYHYAQEGTSGPPTLWEWLERSSALAMFNAGQYYPDFSYMGLLVLGGKAVQPKLHHSFQALFAAEPLDSRPPLARILDLSRDAFDPLRPAYREVAQSFMLLDRYGEIRVRNSLRVANRTVLAQGREGRIWIFVTHGGYTLWEFGEMLRSSPFPILQAMAMDGGFEAQMVIRVGTFVYDNLGEWDERAQSGRQGPMTRRPLPTVIGVFPRN